MTDRPPYEIACPFVCLGGLFILVGIDLLIGGSPFIEPLGFGVIILLTGAGLLRYHIKDERASGKLAILFPCVGSLFVIIGVDLLFRGFPLEEYTQVLVFGMVILVIGILLLRHNIKRNWEW